MISDEIKNTVTEQIRENYPQIKEVGFDGWG